MEGHETRSLTLRYHTDELGPGTFQDAEGSFVVSKTTGLPHRNDISAMAAKKNLHRSTSWDIAFTKLDDLDPRIVHINRPTALRDRINRRIYNINRLTCPKEKLRAMGYEAAQVSNEAIYKRLAHCGTEMQDKMLIAHFSIIEGVLTYYNDKIFKDNTPSEGKSTVVMDEKKREELAKGGLSNITRCFKERNPDKNVVDNCLDRLCREDLAIAELANFQQKLIKDIRHPMQHPVICKAYALYLTDNHPEWNASIKSTLKNVINSDPVDINGNRIFPDGNDQTGLYDLTEEQNRLTVLSQDLQSTMYLFGV